MVRNVTSTADLREGVETINHSSPAFQLRGADDYTKSLMNRVATGEATESERQLFDERVSEMQTPGPSAYYQHPPPLLPPYTAPTFIDQSKRKTQSSEVSEEQQNIDYHLQLILLEQQNKKRLLMAKQEEPELWEQMQKLGYGAPATAFEPPPAKIKNKSGKKAGKNAQGAVDDAEPNFDTLPSPTAAAMAEQDDWLMSAWGNNPGKKKKGKKAVAIEEAPPPPTPRAAVTEALKADDDWMWDWTASYREKEQKRKPRDTDTAPATASAIPSAPIEEKPADYDPWASFFGPKKDKKKSKKDSAPIVEEKAVDDLFGKLGGGWDSGWGDLPPSKTEKKSSKKNVSDDPWADFLMPTPAPPKPAGLPDDYGYPWDPKQNTTADRMSNLGLDEQVDKKVKKGNKNTGKDKKKGSAKKQAVVADLDEDHVEAPKATCEAASVYTKPFLDFMTNNPTVFHAIESQKKELLDLGWTELDERKKWDIEAGGKYFVERNGSSMIAFSVGENYKPGNGCAIIAGHVDALTAKLKPISEVPNKAGYVQLGVAPYAGALNNTWWDRDLGIGGRVLVKEDGKIVTKLVKLDWPIARIPTLAPHFGAAASGPFNPETQMVPIIGLESTETSFSPDYLNKPFSQPPILGRGDGPVGNFVNTQPPALVKAIGDALGLTAATYGNMVNWELELFDVQPATTGGLNKEFIFAGRLDDKLCSWAAMQALISGQQWNDAKYSSIIKMVGWFDNEEIGSGLRQGAKGNFMPLTIERAVGCLGKGKKSFANLMGRTYANSFLVSSDVTHAVNPNFLNAYLENHSPHLNVGLSVHADPNGHMTSDAVSTALLTRCAEAVGAKLQVFQIRNDSRSGGTIGPMLSTMTGIRAIDAGIPQLSMHSIRATTGSLDPGLGVITYMGFLNRFEHVDKEFGGD